MKRWHLALAGFAVYAVGQGVGVQSHALWYLLLGQDLGYSRATLAVGTMLFHLAAALAGVIAGRWMDRHQSRDLLVLGTGGLLVGSLGLSVVFTLWGIYSGFLLLGIGFACLGPVVVGKLLTVYPPGRDRTAAMTLATSGTQVGLLLTPATTWLAVHGGRMTFGLCLAGITLGVIVSLLPSLSRATPVSLEPETAAASLTLPQAQRQSAYWLFAASVFLVVTAQAGYAAHSVLIYSERSSLATGAWLSALAATCGVLARLGMFFRPPACTPTSLAVVVYGAEAIGMGLLAAGWMVPGAMLFGYTATLTLMLEPLVAAHLCGTQTYGTLYGPIYAGSRIAAALGALVYGGVYTAYGSYTPVLWVMTGGLAVACVLMRRVRPLITCP